MAEANKERAGAAEPADMVERVAKRLYEIDYDFPWEKALDVDLTDYRAHAVSIIAAMREPTTEMLHAAMLTFVRENGGIEYAPSVGWRAMIDEALANAPAGSKGEPFTKEASANEPQDKEASQACP